MKRNEQIWSKAFVGKPNSIFLLLKELVFSVALRVPNPSSVVGNTFNMLNPSSPFFCWTSVSSEFGWNQMNMFILYNTHSMSMFHCEFGSAFSPSSFVFHLCIFLIWFAAKRFSLHLFWILWFTMWAVCVCMCAPHQFTLAVNSLVCCLYVVCKKGSFEVNGNVAYAQMFDVCVL